MRCYRVPFSTNVERVALAAGHKRIALEWIDVDPDDRSLVEAASGQPLVPVLLDGDEVIADSPRILLHLEERFPEPPLLPASPARRAEVLVFCDWFNETWKRPPNRIAARGHDDAQAARMLEALRLFEGLLDGRDYLFGDFGLADVTAFPFLKYAAFGRSDEDTDPFHEVLVRYQPLATGSPLRAWAERVDAHPRS